MLKHKVLLLILAMSVLFAFSLDSYGAAGNTGFTGAEWKEIGQLKGANADSMKVIVINSLYQGYSYGFTVVSKKNKQKIEQEYFERYLPFNITSAELIKYVDKVYSDPLNENLQLFQALTIVKQELNGRDKAELEKIIMQQRLIAALRSK
ncbi:MAG: hypothetical protein HQL28_04855 [Candidatus Omnitrophica bacterium]|nr:hypothetical protein [Candidatus Omnitrophota bacterium]